MFFFLHKNYFIAFFFNFEAPRRETKYIKSTGGGVVWAEKRLLKFFCGAIQYSEFGFFF